MLEKPCYMFNPVKNCSIILVLFLIISFHSFQVILDFKIPCNASTPTISIVPFCPNNTQTYKEAADKKNCSAIPHMCKSFVYHCVRNKEKNALIELCAPYLNFIGNRNNSTLASDPKLIHKYIWTILNENGPIQISNM